MTTAAAGLFPYVLPARPGHRFGLTVDNAASGPHALEIAAFWWPVGIVLALIYFAVAYRVFVRGRGALTR
jgi:cytochrome bd-type quinol oxidase subunit 2